MNPASRYLHDRTILLQIPLRPDCVWLFPVQGSLPLRLFGSGSTGSISRLGNLQVGFGFFPGIGQPGDEPGAPGAAEPMPVSLDEVLIALDTLGASPDFHPVPTIHG
jgi:hypothetical protein